jgi:transcriptional regulator with XRE-family HTH domain
MGRIDFGNILRKLRHGRDETLEQVSEATGLSVAMLSRIERGERLPSPESVELLARHFEIPVDYLMSETIAHRMVNRYGEESTSRAAEHLSRDFVDRGPFAATDAAGEADDTRAGAEPPASSHPISRRRMLAYGPFEAMDIRAALGARETRATEPVVAAESKPAVVPLVAAPTAGPVAGYAGTDPTIPAAGGSEGAAGDSEIDPATDSVLRAARGASEAAAVLVLREAPSLSQEARLELVDRIAMLAGQAADVLRTLASDPDRRVRAAARDALNRLAQP